MKKPIIYSLSAVVYIVFVVSLINFIGHLELKETIMMPMAVLGLFVLSVAVMGFLFLSGPLTLYLDGHKKEAMAFFGKTLGFFACFVIINKILILLF